MKLKRTTRLLAALLLGAGFGSGSALAEDLFANLRSGKPDIVRIEQGELRGYQSAGASSFLGIPYAAPPVGEGRWRPPAPAASWAGVRDAGSFGNSCVQVHTFGDFAEKSEAEDCLYLNVFAPATGRDRLRPVMVWLHGGGLINGRSNDYDGRRLVTDGNTVVVSLNYRLNLFGFLAHPALDAEGHPSVSYGVLDQQAALQWVRRNIKAFGGDPDNVTLFGESAGGLAILFNMVSPSAAGLFHKATLQSGVSVAPQIPLEAAQAHGTKFAAAAGCADQSAACLRSLSVAQIIERANSYTATAIRAVDGRVMKQPVQQALAEGNFHKVPVLAGNNRDEFNWFIALNELAAGKPLRAEEYVPTLIKQYGEEKGQKIAAEYPLARYGSPSEALAAAQTSWFFICPSFRAMRSIAKHAPVYAYEFIDTQAPPAFKPVSFPYGAGHTLEIQYLFPRFHGARGTPHELSGAQARLSAEMTGYWTRFAAKGDPNGGSAPRWERFAGKEGPVQLLSPAGTRTAPDSGVDRKCGFWDAL